MIRGRDYHVDWINPDGTRASSPKVPFEWQRLSDEDKVAFIDSVKAARERMGANAPMAMTPGGGGQQVIAGGPPPGAGGGEPRRRGDGSTPPPSGGPNGMTMTMPQINFVPPSELPDYKPPFLPGAVRADAEGNLWVRTVPTRMIPGGPIYDVINRKGELVERVQVPAGRQIVGFGPDGAVYLMAREGTGPTAVTTLERARVR
jgi:hypothetical protein